MTDCRCTECGFHKERREFADVSKEDLIEQIIKLRRSASQNSSNYLQTATQAAQAAYPSTQADLGYPRPLGYRQIVL